MNAKLIRHGPRTKTEAGTYTVQLVVNDGFADSQPDTVTITAITGANLA